MIYVRHTNNFQTTSALYALHVIKTETLKKGSWNTNGKNEMRWLLAERQVEVTDKPYRRETERKERKDVKKLQRQQ